MKKLLLAILSCMVLFTFTAPATVDAKPRSGSYSTPKKSYTPTTPSKSQTDNVTRSDQGNTAKTPGTTAQAANRGFFSGGSLFKGMLIGGLAGMLFGGLFGNMGFMGNVLGFMVNMLAIVVLIIAIKGIVSYFIRRRNETRAKRY